MDQEHSICTSGYIREKDVIGAGSQVWHSCHIQSGATIGTNFAIACDNTAGKSAIIGAGAIVTRDISDFGLKENNV